MATRATFRLPRNVNVNEWIKTNFPGVTDFVASRTEGEVVVEVPQAVDAAGKAAVETAVAAAWTAVKWETI